MSLAALQRDFRAWLAEGLAEETEDVARWVGPQAAGGLAVYRNAYRVQLVDCLKDTFARTHLWLGEDAFVAAALAHIAQVPPTGWTLGAYGADFAATLCAMWPGDPEVAELATLEWALSRAFEGPDSAAVSAATLGTVDWDRAMLVPVPTLALYPASTNAGAIWSALAAESDPPAAALLPAEAAMLVWRQDFTPCFRTIEADERDALELVLAGAPFAALCEALIARLGQDAGIARAGGLLGQWLEQGLIARIVG